jgi:site-specific DNA-methyltransferase (adenine-specific)
MAGHINGDHGVAGAGAKVVGEVMREWVSGDGRVRLINGDCVSYMKGLPDKCFELAVVDPPYGLERFNAADGGNSKKIQSFGDSDKNWNNIKPTTEYFQELFRVSAHQIIWGGNNFNLPQSEYFIIWDKIQMMPSFARCEMAWTNCKVPAKIFAARSQDAKRIHPTQKPVALYRWLLHNYANEGDRILDTHGGSMSSVIACHEKGFAITCCELDADYYDAGLARVQKAMQQQTLDLGV